MRRILFVSRTDPGDFTSAVYGIYQRMRLLLEAAAAVSERVDLLLFVDEEKQASRSPEAFESTLREKWGILATVRFCGLSSRQATRLNTYVTPLWSSTNLDAFYPTAGRQQADDLRAAIKDDTDLIVLHRLHSALSSLGPRLSVPTVLDLDDVEHVKFVRDLRQQSIWMGKRFLYLHIPALMLGELSVIRRCDRTFVCSERDQRYLRRFGAGAGVVVVPNSVTIPDIVEEDEGDCLMFLGTYTYTPNVDAAEYLINEIFPIVQDLYPAARLLVVGNRVERLPSSTVTTSSVEYIGLVPDLSDVYRRSAVICCPIRSGGGTRIKIIEAAARGKAVVSTSVGAEGLEFVDGEEILVRDDPRDFAVACVELLRDRQRSRMIGQKARDKAKRYDRRRIAALIASHYVSVAEGRDRLC